jgi:hypothetical protein
MDFAELERTELATNAAIGNPVRVAVHVPDVRDVPLLEVHVHALADPEQPIPVAAGEIEQLHLARHRCRVGNQFRRRLRVRGR